MIFAAHVLGSNAPSLTISAIALELDEEGIVGGVAADRLAETFG